MSQSKTIQDWMDYLKKNFPNAFPGVKNANKLGTQTGRYASRQKPQVNPNPGPQSQFYVITAQTSFQPIQASVPQFQTSMPPGMWKINHFEPEINFDGDFENVLAELRLMLVNYPIEEVTKLFDETKKPKFTTHQKNQFRMEFFLSMKPDLSVINKYAKSPGEFKRTEAYRDRLLEYCVSFFGVVDGFNHYWSHLQTFMTKEELESLARPILIKIGQEIQPAMYTQYIKVKWINPKRRGMYAYTENLEFGKYYLFKYDQAKTPPMLMFEFPEDLATTAPLVPKSDYVLFLQDYVTDESEYCEEYFQGWGFKIMKKFSIDSAKLILDKRAKLFDAQPTPTNLVLLFQITDSIILFHAKNGTLDLDESAEKALDRFEKLKNLALSTKFHEERKLAVNRCLGMLEKLVK